MSNRKSCYRDLEKWRKTHLEQKKRYYKKTQDAPNSRLRYTLSDIEMILKHEVSDTELSKIIGRSVQAIQATRSKFKKKEGMTYQ